MFFQLIQKKFPNMVYLISILSFVFLTYALKKLAFFINLLDKPNFRKKHIGEIPLIGGIIIYINIFVFGFYFEISYFFNIIIITSSILIFLGAIDDSIELGVNFRLIAQLISCLVVIGSGLVINNIGDYMFLPKIETGIWSVVLTIFCVIGLTNSFNFIDGIDGLCAGLALTAIGSILIFAFFNNGLIFLEDKEYLLLICLSIVCFLIFNITSFSKVFLGDSGSMFLGFLVSWLLIMTSQSENQIIHPILTIWCVTIPVFDIISVVTRRILRGINPFKPDRRHIHHLLLELGINNHIVSLLIIVFAILLNFFGLMVFISFGPFPSLLSFLLLLFLYLIFMIFLSRSIYKKNI